MSWLDIDAARRAAERIYRERARRERVHRLALLRSIIGRESATDAELVEQEAQFRRDHVFARFRVQVEHRRRLINRALRRARSAPIRCENVHQHKILKRGQPSLDSDLHPVLPADVSDRRVTEAAGASSLGRGGDA